MSAKALSRRRISTHTLTWSVTQPVIDALESFVISTHTLTWSVTYCSGVIFPLSAISTHTLTWSVTIVISYACLLDFHFNSHAHVERDSIMCRTKSDTDTISTHTLTWSVTPWVSHSTPRVSISTHTLTWSVTRSPYARAFPNYHFNSHAHVERDDHRHHQKER